MKKTLISIALLTIVGRLIGAHLIGGEMYYTCVGIGSYEITINMYRDCASNGADFDSAFGAFTTGRLTVYEGDQNIRTVDMPSPTIEHIDLTTGNPCLEIPPNLCVEQGVYHFNLQLPISSESYHIVYQRCCRNPTINNLVDPGEVGGTYAVEITPLGQVTCNSSPQFISRPPSVVCVNELLTYDHSATDDDGDIIQYSFCQPFNGGTRSSPAPSPDSPPPWNPLRFLDPYSFDNPIGGDPIVNINEDGVISGIPNQLGQYVVTVCATEFRNGQILSTSRREYQFNVNECISVLEAQIGSATVEDDVFVISKCGDNLIEFADQSFPQDNIETYYWELPICNTDTLQWDEPYTILSLPKDGIYNGFFVANPNTQCSDTAYFKIIITPLSDPYFDYDFDRCQIGNISFNNSLLKPSVTDIKWDFGDGNSSILENPNHTYSSPGSFPVTLTYIDSLGCSESYIDIIRYYPLPNKWEIKLDSMTDTKCPPVDLFFSIDSDFLTDEYDVNWSTGDGGRGSGYQYTHTYQVSGTYDVSVDIESPSGCMDSKSYPAFVDLPFGFYVPNIFSPDAYDVDNREFCLSVLCDLNEYEIKIYDNRGNIVWRSTDVNACWDGYFNGNRAEVGVYVYRIDYHDKFSVPRRKFGDITLLY